MKLFDIIEVFIAGDWGEETYSKETPCAVTCVRGADIIPISEYDFSAIPVRYISQQAYAKKCLQVGDIIIEKSGGSPTQSTGRVSLVSQELLDHAGAVICSNFCTAFRVKKGWIPLYVYYYLQFIYNLGAFFNFEGKTSGIKNLQLDAAFAAIPTEDISESIQNNIVVILQGLEKKIAINRQINQNLEAMAKQLYDYWFVQFDFPDENGKPYKSSGGKMVWDKRLKREIPLLWKAKIVEEVADVYNGATPSTVNELNYGGDIVWITPKDLSDQKQKFVYQGERNISQVGYDSCSTHLLPSNTILMSSRAPIGLLAIAKTELCTNQGFKSFVSKSKNIATYLYYYLQYHITQIEQLGTGTTFKEVSREDILKFPMLKPSDNVLDLWEEIVSALNDRQLEIQKENENLIKQRDELLPLLMNGQVSVNSDLAVSYIIYKDINIRIMKENIIQAIVAEMQRDLDCRQMARLKAVLTSELHNVEIIEKSDCATQQTQENELLLNSFISAKKIEGCSDKTLTYYRNTIERLLVTLSLAICHITTTDIRTYLSDYQEEHQSSKVTIDNMRRIFSSFFAWLEDEDYIAKSPVRRIHKVKTDSLVKEVLSDEQLEQLRDSCTTKRDLAIIDFLSSTGIRVGELVKLSREDIDFHERQCVVFGKGNKERVVYFNARTKLHLQQYLNERTDSNPALFVSLNSPHSRLTISGVEVRIRKMGQALSMPKVHPHKFRRTLATMAIDKGMPIEQVQRLLGHVRIDTTLHYAIVNQNNVKLAHKKYLG